MLLLVVDTAAVAVLFVVWSSTKLFPFFLSSFFPSHSDSLLLLLLLS
jgi:hypothetical protein